LTPGVPPSKDAAGVVLKVFGYHGGPLVLDIVTPVLLQHLPRFSACRADDVMAARFKLLAALLMRPADHEPAKITPILLQLVDATHVGGGTSEAPFAGVTERFVSHSLQEMDLRMPQLAASEDDSPEPNAEICQVA
jgi:hypothetical protein